MNQLIPTPELDSISPQFCVNGRLRRLHRMVNRLYMQALQPFGLRGSMLSILFIIGKIPGVSQRQISERLVLDASTMSRDLDKLVKRNIIEKKKSATDGRYSSLYLTESGSLFLEEVIPVWKNLHKRMEELISDDHFDCIDALLISLQNELT